MYLTNCKCGTGQVMQLREDYHGHFQLVRHCLQNCREPQVIGLSHYQDQELLALIGKFVEANWKDIELKQIK